jgi:hypothetical protein
VGHYGSSRRRYTRAEEVGELAVCSYKKNGKGITFNDLLSNGLARNKGQAQTTLKHRLRKKIIFAPEKRRPQDYYPTSLKAGVMKRTMLKNIPKGVTGVGCFSKASASITSPSLDSVVNQSLEGYVLPLLPSTTLHIHKMQLKLRITSECYAELKLLANGENKGKEYGAIVGNCRVCYHFYANGTVMVFTESNNSPFKLEDETDLSRLMAYFGQVRDRLVTFLADSHERIVPDIMHWEMTQCDINKDVQVSDWLQYTGLKVQVRHLDHLFRVYIKSMGNRTICRVEDAPKPKKLVIDAINDIFNPVERFEKQSLMQAQKICEIHDMLSQLLVLLASGTSRNQEGLA